MKKILVLLAVLAVFPLAVFCQTAPKASVAEHAVLAFADDETQLIITDGLGNPLVPSEGLVLPVGTLIQTKKTSAEIQLKPNGSIIKIAEATTFKIENLRLADNTGSNDFALIGGKIRTVAAKLGGLIGPGYNIRTATANCGVRGTDFAMEYDPANSNDYVCVQEGQVEFTNITTGATVPVAANQIANTFDSVFQSAPADPARMSQIFSNLAFVKLNPVDVPGKAVSKVADMAQAEKPAEAPASEPASQLTAKSSSADDPLTRFLRNFFGLEIGSVTIDGKMYSKAILTPTLSADNFKLKLYLPVIYTNDLFNTADWYRPSGNNEWSFGSDQSGWQNQASDFAEDLALKIQDLEWGRQGVDPFYLKVGNLDNMTLGHGSVVRNFANDQDFPSVRKIGLNAGAQFGPLSLEGLVDDIAQASVVGGHLGIAVLGDQFALGAQGVADLHWANNQDLQGTSDGLVSSYYGDPILLVGGLDTQLFKIDFGPAFRTKAFADVNTLAPYFRTAATPAGFTPGLSLKTVWRDGQPASGGAETGFLGNLFFVDYRLSFQADRGLYSNAIFQGNYYRNRSSLLNRMVAYFNNPDPYDKTYNLGIFGSAGFNLFNALIMDLAYRYPLTLDANGNLSFNDSADYVRIGLNVPKDKIPFVRLSGGVSYERTGFAHTVIHGGHYLDANTVVGGNVVYGLADSVDLMIGVTSSVLRDTQGNTVYDSTNQPKVGPTITIDTKVSL